MDDFHEAGEESVGSSLAVMSFMALVSPVIIAAEATRRLRRWWATRRVYGLTTTRRTR